MGPEQVLGVLRVGLRRGESLRFSDLTHKLTQPYSCQQA